MPLAKDRATFADAVTNHHHLFDEKLFNARVVKEGKDKETHSRSHFYIICVA